MSISSIFVSQPFHALALDHFRLSDGIMQRSSGALGHKRDYLSKRVITRFVNWTCRVAWISFRPSKPKTGVQIPTGPPSYLSGYSFEHKVDNCTY